MRPLVRLLALGPLLALAAGCGATVPPDVAASVDGREIPRSLLETAVSSTEEQVIIAAERNALATEADVLSEEGRITALESHQRDMLALLVQDAVVTNAVVDADIDVDALDVASLREEIVELVGGEEQLEALLVQDGLSMAIFNEVLMPQQAQIVALREQLAEGQVLELRTVRHILVESVEEAEEIIADLEDGADFAELAAERSIDVASAEQGGELPPAPRGEYVPEFEEAVWNAEVGDLLGPIETQFGVHVVEVTAHEETPAEELDPAELDPLVSEDVNALVEASWADADVEIAAAFGTWDAETRMVAPRETVGDAPEVPAISEAS